MRPSRVPMVMFAPYTPPADLYEVLDTQLACIEAARPLGKARLGEAYEHALRAVDAAFVRAHGLTARARAAVVCGCDQDHVVAQRLSETIKCAQLEAIMRPMIVVALQEAPEELAVFLLAIAANRGLFPMPSPVRMALSMFSFSKFALRYPGRVGAEPVAPGDQAPTVARVWWTPAVRNDAAPAS